ncbi:hypothetical protein [Paenarthrobacter sp. NCHU4564]|uniref:hypothetical protein n=1 Tax=Paenarthrobacter sp. NCHU4564 TaxID=3451353 RepID=UPI003F9B45DA
MATAAVVLLALSACGVPAASTHSGAPTPTAACPSAGTEPLPTNCVPYDGDAAMAANETYRQRGKLSPDVQAELNQHIAPAVEALQKLPRPATADTVTAAFNGLHLKEVQTDDGGTGVRFGVTVPSGGCLFGFVPDQGDVTVQAGGGIMDGGCLEMFGH